MHKSVKKNNVIRRYMEALALHTGAPTLHWEYNTSFIYVVEFKRVTPIIKHIGIPVFFLLEFFTMVSLFQNMISLVSCQNICAPNHVQFQLSVGLINGWLDSDSIQPVIHNTINSWYYTNLLWTKRIIKRTKISLMH